MLEEIFSRCVLLILFIYARFNYCSGTIRTTIYHLQLIFYLSKTRKKSTYFVPLYKKEKSSHEFGKLITYLIMNF